MNSLKVLFLFVSILSTQMVAGSCNSSFLVTREIAGQWNLLDSRLSKHFGWHLKVLDNPSPISISQTGISISRNMYEQTQNLQQNIRFIESLATETQIISLENVPIDSNPSGYFKRLTNFLDFMKVEYSYENFEVIFKPIRRIDTLQFISPLNRMAYHASKFDVQLGFSPFKDNVLRNALGFYSDKRKLIGISKKEVLHMNFRELFTAFHELMHAKNSQDLMLLKKSLFYGSAKSKTLDGQRLLIHSQLSAPGLYDKYMHFSEIPNHLMDIYRLMQLMKSHQSSVTKNLRLEIESIYSLSTKLESKLEVLDAIVKQSRGIVKKHIDISHGRLSDIEVKSFEGIIDNKILVLTTQSASADFQFIINVDDNNLTKQENVITYFKSLDLRLKDISRITKKISDLAQSQKIEQAIAISPLLRKLSRAF